MSKQNQRYPYFYQIFDKFPSQPHKELFHYSVAAGNLRCRLSNGLEL